VTSRFRTAILASAVAALVLAPVVAEAQSRRAVARPRATVVRPRTSVVVGARYYRPYYGFYYDPFFYGASWYSPFYYPYYPYYYGHYYGQYYGQYPYYGRGYYDLSSSLRLQVTPRQTEVYIDGYFAGTVDDFDGIFQRLHLEPGDHDLQLYLPGHRNFTQKVYLQPGRTFSVKHTMETLRGGEPEPVKPTAQAAPRGSASPGPARRAPRPLPGPRDRDRDRDPDADRDRDRDRDAAPDRDRAANADYGTIALRVQPGDADITIDGERWEGPGDGERLSVQLPAGVHSVQIRKDGFRTYNTDITVRRGETTPLNVALTKQ
jgi:PEGA domain-containing protein